MTEFAKPSAYKNINASEYRPVWSFKVELNDVWEDEILKSFKAYPTTISVKEIDAHIIKWSVSKPHADNLLNHLKKTGKIVGWS